MRIPVRSDDLLYLGKLCIPVDDKIFRMDSGADGHVGEYHAVLDYGPLLDVSSSSYDTVINSAFNKASVRYNRILCSAIL